MIEDDPLLVNIYSAFFRNQGLESSMVTDGASALEEVNKYKPDVILLDLMMPKIGGLGILDQLAKAGNKAPIIIYTNLDTDDKRKEVMEKGAKDFISKSQSDPQGVLEVIKKYLPIVPPSST